MRETHGIDLDSLLKKLEDVLKSNCLCLWVCLWKQRFTVNSCLLRTVRTIIFHKERVSQESSVVLWVIDLSISLISLGEKYVAAQIKQHLCGFLTSVPSTYISWICFGSPPTTNGTTTKASLISLWIAAIRGPTSPELAHPFKGVRNDPPGASAKSLFVMALFHLFFTDSCKKTNHGFFRFCSRFCPLFLAIRSLGQFGWGNPGRIA